MGEIKSFQSPNKPFDVKFRAENDQVEIRVTRGNSYYILRADGKIEYNVAKEAFYGVDWEKYLQLVPPFITLPSFLWEAIRGDKKEESKDGGLLTGELKDPLGQFSNDLVNNMQKTIDSQFIIINKLLDGTGSKETAVEVSKGLRGAKRKHNGPRNRPSQS